MGLDVRSGVGGTLRKDLCEVGCIQLHRGLPSPASGQARHGRRIQRSSRRRQRPAARPTDLLPVLQLRPLAA